MSFHNYQLNHYNVMYNDSFTNSNALKSFTKDIVTNIIKKHSESYILVQI